MTLTAILALADYGIDEWATLCLHATDGEIAERLSTRTGMTVRVGDVRAWRQEVLT